MMILRRQSENRSASPFCANKTLVIHKEEIIALQAVEELSDKLLSGVMFLVAFLFPTRAANTVSSMTGWQSSLGMSKLH